MVMMAQHEWSFLFFIYVLIRSFESYIQTCPCIDFIREVDRWISSKGNCFYGNAFN